MVIFNKYVNNRDYCWYDSSNVIYSECYDNEGPAKNVKVVFKNGGTYLYKNVSNDDYISFRQAESNGKALNEHLKKYEYVRLSDTSIDDLENTKTEFINESTEIQEAFSNFAYRLAYNDATGEFTLFLNGKPIYNGIEGKVSIVNLLRAMSIGYSMTEMTDDEKALLEENKNKV